MSYERTTDAVARTSAAQRSGDKLAVLIGSNPLQHYMDLLIRVAGQAPGCRSHVVTSRVDWCCLGGLRELRMLEGAKRGQGGTK